MNRVAVAGDGVYADIAETMEIIARLGDIAVPDVIPVVSGAGAFDAVIINGYYDAPVGFEWPYAGSYIVNSDEKNAHGQFPKNKAGNVITYGLNKRACITASSVVGETILFCIQRSFKSLTGEALARCEFSLPYIQMSDAAKIYPALAAVAAALVCGSNIKQCQQVKT